MKNTPHLLSPSHLKFLFRATNQHGVHSPFAYALVTMGLYAKSHLPPHELLILQQKPLMPKRYFRALNNLLHFIIPGNNTAETGIRGLHLQTPITEVVLIDRYQEDIMEVPMPTNEHTAVVVIKPGDDPGWKQAIQDPEIHLSVDCFYFGVLFKRSDQARQAFKIRI